MLEAISEFYHLRPLAIFSVFILGFLVIILIQNIFFYRIYKDNAYLWYAIYALIIILDQTLVNTSFYYRLILEKDLPIIYPLHVAFEWSYNSAYLIFVIEILNLFFLQKDSGNIDFKLNIIKHKLVIIFRITNI